jgi:hypothetical protein
VTDSDSPWKELLEENLRETLAFFFPEIDAEVDWERDYEVLRQELLPAAPSGGKRIADVVVKAFSGGGDERYLHGEVQGQKEAGFERRIYVYNSRIDDKAGLPVTSFVLLIDEDPTWRPDRYEATLCGKSRALEFHSRKIIDWLGKEEELKTHPNPVGLFVLAQLASMRTKKDDEARAEAKFDMIVLLQERFADETERGRWYRYLDWLLSLPAEYDLRVWDRVRAMKEKTMPYVTFAERYAMEKGEERGLHKAVEAILKVRYPESIPSLMPLVRRVEGSDALEHMIQLATESSLDELRSAIEAAQPATQ